MDHPPLLSNTALLAEMSQWEDGVRGLARVALEYSQEVGDAGVRVAGGAWTAAIRGLEGLVARSFPPEGSELAALMGRADALEEADAKMMGDLAVVLDTRVREQALRSTNRTRSENISGLLKKSRGLLGDLPVFRNRVIGVAGAAGVEASGSATVGDVQKLYSGARRSSVSTEIYVSILLCRARQAHGPAARIALDALEDAKDASLGLEPDTKGVAEADSGRLLAAYHPLQVMQYTPSAFREVEGGSDGAVCLRVPAAKFAVSYRIEPLVSRGIATELYGKMATTVTGLNYKLVERLRTISASVLPPRAAIPPPARATEPPPSLATDEGVLVTLDGVSAARYGPPPSVLPGQAWAPFSGGRPRAAAYEATSAEVISAAIVAEFKAGWGAGLRKRFEAAVAEERVRPGTCNEGALLAELARQFEREYDSAPPKGPRDFRALVLGDGPSSTNYICRAIARAEYDELDARLLTLHYRPGATRLPHDVVVREMRASLAVHVADAGRAVWKRLKDGFMEEGPGAFGMAPDHRKTALLRSFRVIAERAVKAAPLVCSPPTLKAFAAFEPAGGPE